MIGPDPPASPRGRAFGVPARRQEVVRLLSEAYARNDLEQEELERRLELAERARSIEELEALVEDFPPALRRPGAGATPAPPVPSVDSRRELDRQLAELDGLPAPTRFVLLGDQRTAVAPSDPRVLRTLAVIGDITVDLRALSGQPGVFLLKVAALIGDTRIIVPRGTPVDTRLLSLIGDQKRGPAGRGALRRLAGRLGLVSEKEQAPPPAPGPHVVVTGFKLIGDTVIVEQ